MSRPYDFDEHTKLSALVRQWFHCGSCGEHIWVLGEAGREIHVYGEIGVAHHMVHHKEHKNLSLAECKRLASLDNCVILCGSCHYSAHEGGNYTHGTVMGEEDDFPYFYGYKRK